MSEQALKLSTSGNTPVAIKAAAGATEGLVLPEDKAKSGNPLPLVAPDRESLEAVAKELTKTSQTLGRDLRFQVDLQNGGAVLQVLDSETGEMIRQIPGERVAASITEGNGQRIQIIDDMI